ncbi:MAG: hypothetical protein QOI24_4461 [Acidobacteriota bacterium]|jgi:hypothetical protein|nr:hypothetical protein [Acidobacteriota bacterium]
MKIQRVLLACAISLATLTASAATFTVTTNADSGAGSLRQAIADANAAGTASTITFDLPRAIAIIKPLTPLPEVAANGTLDGRLPVGSPANGGIEINGSSCTAPQSNGLVTSGVVSFLRFTYWNGFGIDAKGSAVVSTCTVGIGEAREPRPNANGIRAADRASIGDPNASPNTIAGNIGAGIVVNSSTAVVITGNYIGLDLTPNAIGVLIEGDPQTPMNVVIDQAGQGRGNTFGRNTSAQVEVRHSTGVKIANNTFTDTHSDSVGVRIKDSTAVNVTSNIFQWQHIGVSVEGTSSRNMIVGNAMQRTGIGIDLNGDGRTANDDRDGDSGPNALQNYPTLTSAIPAGTSVTVSGVFNSAPNQTFEIDFYTDGQTCSSTGSEGWTLRDTKSVTTDAAGNAPLTSIITGLNTGTTITATARDSSGNTSEFSNCVHVEAHGTLSTAGTFSVVEGTATADVVVTRSGRTSGAVTADYTTSNGSATAGADYSAISGTVRFADGESSKVISVPILNDSLYEGPETFTLTFSNPTGGVLISGSVAWTTITVQDDETRPIAVPANVSVIEGDSGKKDATFVVTLTGAQSTIPITFRYYTSPGTASAGQDFDSIAETSLTFAPGQTTANINVPIVGDTDAETDESFSLTIFFAQWGTDMRYASGTILNDDGLNELRVEDITVVEGDSGIRNVNVRITAKAPFTGKAYVSTRDVTAIAGSDYTARGIPLDFLNSKEETLALVTYGDLEAEADETFEVTLSSSSTLAKIVKPVGTVTIENDDPEITPKTLDIARGSKKTVTVRLAQVLPADAVLTVTTAQPASFAAPAQVIVRAGTRILTFDVTALAAPATSRVDVTFPPGLGDRVLSMNVTSFEPVTLVLQPAPVKVTVGSSVTVTASLTPAALDPQTIALSAADPRAIDVPSSVTIEPGGSATFTVTGRAVASTGVQATLPSRYGGQIVTLFVDVLAQPTAPQLLSVSPANGPAAGGTMLNVSGLRLKSDCSVTFDGTPAQTTFMSDARIDALTPPHAPATVDVRLSCSSGSYTLANAFTYLSAGPTLTSVIPSFGNISGGTIVKLNGTNLSSACGVFFDGTPARGVESHGNTALTAIAPPHSAATIGVSIRCNGATSTLGSSFAYVTAEEPAAAIARVDPESGAAGQQVTITGSRFRTHDSVTFGPAASPIVSTTGETHVVRVPDLPAGKVAITITDPNGHITTTGPIFTIVEAGAPRITGANPTTVITGNEIVVDGDGFRAGYGFALGDRVAAIISIAYTRAVIRVPAIDGGTYPLNVINAAGNVAAIGPSIVVASHGVAVNSVSTSCGSTDGGETITIRGSGFASGANVTIANVAATNIIVVDANTITATIPASSSAGSARIVVTNPNGDSGSLTGAFRYVSPFDPDGCGGMRRRVGSRP